MLSIFDGLVVASTTCLDDIIMIFGVGFEGDFSIAVGTLEVKPEDLDAQVDLFVADLHSHVELGPDIEIVSAGVTPETHGQHVTDHHELVLAPTAFYDQLVVEVLRVIFD